jgi:protein gp37
MPAEKCGFNEKKEGIMNLTDIEWATHCHNIMTGCLHGCPYCYARKTAENPFYRKAFPYGFEPHFYQERIQQVAKLKKPAIIFMDSMSDLFGSWWTDEQILKVLHVMDNMRGVHWHKYVVLTKNPARMVEILGRYCITDGVDRLNNVYFGTSITGLGDALENSRIICLNMIHRAGYKTVLSMEPLLHCPPESIPLYGVDWLIIGGQTKPTKEIPIEWLLYFCGMNIKIPVFLKENTGLQNLREKRKDMFPADLLPIAQAWGKA